MRDCSSQIQQARAIKGGAILRARTATRDAAIVAMTEAGASRRTVAREIGLSCGQVHKIVRRERGMAVDEAQYRRRASAAELAERDDERAGAGGMCFREAA